MITHCFWFFCFLVFFNLEQFLSLFFFFFFSGNWGLYPGPWVYYANLVITWTMPTAFLSVFCFWVRVSLTFPGLASSSCLPNNWDYRQEPPCLALKSFCDTNKLIIIYAASLKSGFSEVSSWFRFCIFGWNTR
jgi:hypothetical protein